MIQDKFMKMVQEEIRKFIDTHDAPIIPVSSQNTIDAFQHCTNSLTALNMASPSLIKYYIKTRNNKKSSGYDGIPNFFLIKLSNKFIDVLTLLINHCYNIGYFPNLWKTAIVAPIPKKGNLLTPPQDAGKYHYYHASAKSMKNSYWKKS